MADNIRYLTAPPPGQVLINVADLEHWTQTMLAASMAVSTIQRKGVPNPEQLEDLRRETARTAREMAGLQRFGIPTHTAGR